MVWLDRAIGSARRREPSRKIPGFGRSSSLRSWPDRTRFQLESSKKTGEGPMRNRLARNHLVTACAGLVVVGLVFAAELRAQGQPAPATPAPVAPPDTAALRAQYERWRTEFKTWGKWAPVGQESKGTTNLITPEKVASAMRLAKDGIVVSLAHAEPQVAAADVAPAGLFRRTTNNITDVGKTDS